MDNKTIRMILLAVVWGASFFLMRQFIFPKTAQETVHANPKTMLAQARKVEEKAGKDQEKLQVAIKAYNKAAKENKKTETAAEAKLAIGEIQETKLAKQPNPVLHWFGLSHAKPGEMQTQSAINTYKAIEKEFKRQSYPAVAEARDRRMSLESELDEANKNTLGYRMIDWLVALTGRNAKYSFAIAILIITIIVKVITTPLSHQQYKSMKEMQKIQPLVKELQAKHKDDQKLMGEKLMALYKEHGVNPFGSCLPLLIQMPILMLLYYKVILAYQYQFAKGEFLWIGSSLAERFPGIVAPNLSMPDIPLLVVYTISMIISQKLSVVDPTQAEQQKIMTYTMPVLFAFIFWSFPAALMLYWLLFNVLSTLQQYHILKPSGNEPPAPPVQAGEKALKQAKPSGVKPRRAKKHCDALLPEATG
ncbi:MAG: YidC/Oxa1 family membrane protein insertase [Armatimonadota bacterium]